MPQKLTGSIFLARSFPLAVYGRVCLTLGASPNEPASDPSLTTAVCPIVYQLDQSPSLGRVPLQVSFGNGFFY